MAHNPPVSLSARLLKNLSGMFSSRRFAVMVGFFLLTANTVFAQVLPKISLSVADTKKPADVAVALQIVFLITILTLAPSILVMMTSFVRIIIVMSFLRRAIGTQTMPPDRKSVV